MNAEFSECLTFALTLAARAVTVRFEPCDGGTAIIVTDDGGGIADEELAFACAPRLYPPHVLVCPTHGVCVGVCVCVCTYPTRTRAMHCLPLSIHDTAAGCGWVQIQLFRLGK